MFRTVLRHLGKFTCLLVLSSMVAVVSPYAVSIALGQATSQWETKWNTVLKAAQAEGKVVVAGPPIREVREGMEKFTKKFRIQVDYIGAPGGSHYARLRPERGARKFTTDLIINGPGTIVQRLYPAGMLQPLRPHLILPEVGCGQWKTKDGCPWFLDPKGESIVRLGNFLSMQIFANPKAVDIIKLTSWKDLLDSRFQSRMTGYEPVGRGPGSELVRYLLRLKGAEFVKALYFGQKVTRSRNSTQMAEWIVRGRYDLGLAISPESARRLEKEGLPIKHVTMSDGPGYLSGGWIAAIGIIDKAPHPNAAAILINWLLSPEGAEMLGRATQYPIVRKDASNEWVPSYHVPKPGVKYVDHHSWEFITKTRIGLDKQLRGIFRK